MQSNSPAYSLNKADVWKIARGALIIAAGAFCVELLTQAKRGVHINASPNCPNPVQQHFEAGESIGINATPTLILPDGELVRGYVRAQPLAARLAQVGKKG